MVDFTNPIEPIEHVKIEKPKQIGDEEEEEKKILEKKPVTKKLFLYLTFLKILSNSLKIFKNAKPKDFHQTPIHQEIQTIKNSLESLKEKDLCQDSEFMNFFAFIWMKFLKDHEDYILKSAEITTLIKKLISEINSYPKDTDFTLGYYISEFAGYKWIPVPYMEILRNLHLEYKKDPEKSHLKAWTTLLDQMLGKV